MRALEPHERKIYKQVTINGDYMNKFTGFLSYMKPFDENINVGGRGIWWKITLYLMMNLTKLY